MGIQTRRPERADELQNHDRKFTEEIRHPNKNREFHERATSERRGASAVD